MSTFMIKVPDGDDGLYLGSYESDYLPRVGDRFFLYHPMLCNREGYPFEAEVNAVEWTAFHESHSYAPNDRSTAEPTVWIVEYGGVPTIYCTCTEEQKKMHGKDADADICSNCGHTWRENT